MVIPSRKHGSLVNSSGLTSSLNGPWILVLFCKKQVHATEFSYSTSLIPYGVCDVPAFGALLPQRSPPRTRTRETSAATIPVAAGCLLLEGVRMPLCTVMHRMLGACFFLQAPSNCEAAYVVVQSGALSVPLHLLPLGTRHLWVPLQSDQLTLVQSKVLMK